VRLFPSVGSSCYRETRGFALAASSRRPPKVTTPPRRPRTRKRIEGHASTKHAASSSSRDRARSSSLRPRPSRAARLNVGSLLRLRHGGARSLRSPHERLQGPRHGLGRQGVRLGAGESPRPSLRASSRASPERPERLPSAAPPTARELRRRALSPRLFSPGVSSSVPDHAGHARHDSAPKKNEQRRFDRSFALSPPCLPPAPVPLVAPIAVLEGGEHPPPSPQRPVPAQHGRG
jgi:hypothetical protein